MPLNPRAGGVPPSGDGWLAPHLSREMRKQKVCDRCARDKERSKIRECYLAKRRLFASRVRDIFVSSILSPGGREGYTSVRRDLYVLPMPYGRRDPLASGKPKMLCRDTLVWKPWVSYKFSEEAYS
jgi:hypothetical protein